MDAAQFDHIARLVARPSSRRSALALATALSLGVSQAEAGKKNKCKGGCPPCRVCKKKRGKKKCVVAPDGTACAEGTCQAGKCCLNTCAGLGNVCGPVNNGCNGTLTCTCGLGATPACTNSQCAACALACPATCANCFNRPDAATFCGDASFTNCAACTRDADCAPPYTFCIASHTDRASNVSSSSPGGCGVDAPGVCVIFEAC